MGRSWWVCAVVGMQAACFGSGGGGSGERACAYRESSGWRFEPIRMRADAPLDPTTATSVRVTAAGSELGVMAALDPLDPTTLVVDAADVPAPPVELTVSLGDLRTADGDTVELCAVGDSATESSWSVPVWASLDDLLPALARSTADPPRLTTAADGYPRLAVVSEPTGDSAVTTISVLRWGNGGWGIEHAFGHQIWGPRTTHHLAYDSADRLVVGWSDAMGSEDFYYSSVNVETWDAAAAAGEKLPILADRVTQLEDFALVRRGPELIGIYSGLAGTGGGSPWFVRVCPWNESMRLWAGCTPVFTDTWYDIEYGMSGDLPVVAYRHYDGRLLVAYAPAAAPAWTVLAEPLDAPQSNGADAVADAGPGAVWVAWRPVDPAIVNIARVELATGTVTRHDISRPGATVGEVHLASAADGTLYAAWPEVVAEDARVTLMRMTTNTWEEISNVPDAAPDEPIDALDLVLDGWDLPVLAFGGGPARSPMRAVRWNGR